MARSVYRSKDYNDLVKKLTEKNVETGVSVFPTIKALQCFAALLGFDKETRVELDRSNVESIEWHTFANNDFTHYIYLIALAETKEVGILKYDENKTMSEQECEDMVKIFEEYANGGFEIIRRWLDKCPSDPYGDRAILMALEREKYIEVIKPNIKEVNF